MLDIPKIKPIIVPTAVLTHRSVARPKKRQIAGGEHTAAHHGTHLDCSSLSATRLLQDVLVGGIRLSVVEGPTAPPWLGGGGIVRGIFLVL